MFDMMCRTITFLWVFTLVLIFTRAMALPTMNIAQILSSKTEYTSIAKTVWLYSTNARGFVRVNGSHVDSSCYECDKTKDESAKLELVSTRFEGAVVLRIRSVKENSYLCVDLEGNLTTEVHGNTMQRCLFKEGMKSGFTTFQSIHNAEWFLGFKRNGKLKQPHNTTNSQKAARFLKYFLS
ncbi:fibroblast growth factor 1-like isoform X1 [Porites lutea]|uniref:fibroblast growth factor 1-like isoform X1 n=2 Tax=Porites lutea TaxID=51062 RepID=UPI003CC54CF6